MMAYAPLGARGISKQVRRTGGQRPRVRTQLITHIHILVVWNKNNTKQSKTTGNKQPTKQQRKRKRTNQQKQLQNGEWRGWGRGDDGQERGVRDMPSNPFQKSQALLTLDPHFKLLSAPPPLLQSYRSAPGQHTLTREENGKRISSEAIGKEWQLSYSGICTWPRRLRIVGYNTFVVSWLFDIPAARKMYCHRQMFLDHSTCCQLR